MIQAASGMAAMYLPARGEPAYAPTAVCDKLAGQMIAVDAGQHLAWKTPDILE